MTRKRREEGAEVTLETMTEISPQMNVHTKPQVQEAQRTPSSINANNITTPRHINFKPQIIKYKENIPPLPIEEQR